MIRNMIFIITFSVLVSCGGSNNNNNVLLEKPKAVFQKTLVEGKEVKISTLTSFPAGDEAIWYLQLIHQGRKLGECKIEVLDTSSSDNIIGFSDENNPDCDGIVIDPSSTSSNLILSVEDHGLQYCIVTSGEKNCQEISVN